MENPEEILHSLEEFSKMKPKDIPRELEEYLCFVAKTGDPVYQWSAIKSLFREKLVNVVTEFYETCPSIEIPPCPNVDLFNYDSMKNFILEKLDTFVAAPFTVQRICELLTTPRKEYSRIDKYMRALEKNILVVSTVEPGGNRRSPENGEGIVNGLESEHLESNNATNDINVDVEMDDVSSWPKTVQKIQENVPKVEEKQTEEASCSSTQDTVITCRTTDEPYVSIEPVKTCPKQDNLGEADVSVTITAIPAGVQKRRNSVEPVVSSEGDETSAEKAEETELEREVNADSSSAENIEETEIVEKPEEEIEASKVEIIDVLPAIEEITCSKIEDCSEIELKSEENEEKLKNDNNESKIENEISSSIINNEAQSSVVEESQSNIDNLNSDNNEAKSNDDNEIIDECQLNKIEDNVELVEEKTISDEIEGGGENVVSSDLNVLGELKETNEETDTTTTTTTTVADSSDLSL